MNKDSGGDRIPAELLQVLKDDAIKVLHDKGNYKQGEKTALRLGENNSKRSNRQRIDFSV